MASFEAPRVATPPPDVPAPALERTVAAAVRLEAKGTFAAWRHGRYVTYLAGLAIGFNAFWVYETALGWLALQLTNSAAGLSLLFTVSSLPMLVLILFGGVLADRFDRKGVVIVSRLAQAIATALLGLLTLSGQMTVPVFVVFALALGVITALNLPALFSFIADLLPSSALHNGYSWQSVVDHGASMIGPIVAGYIVASRGPGQALVISGIGHALMCVLVLFVQPLNRASRSSESVGKRLSGGLRYVGRHEQVLLLMVLAAIPSFTAWGVVPLLPIVARDILHGDAGTYGWLTGAIGVGSIIGALFVAAAHSVHHKGLLAVVGAALTGLALVALAYTQNIQAALLFLLIMGAAGGVHLTLTQALVQVLTPLEYQGRTASIYILTWNLQPAGIILFGAVAELYGVPSAIWLAGWAMTAAVVLLAVLRPAIVRMRV